MFLTLIRDCAIRNAKKPLLTMPYLSFDTQMRPHRTRYSKVPAFPIITTDQRSCRKVMFSLVSLCQSLCLFTSGRFQRDHYMKLLKHIHFGTPALTPATPHYAGTDSPGHLTIHEPLLSRSQSLDMSTVGL